MINLICFGHSKNTEYDNIINEYYKRVYKKIKIIEIAQAKGSIAEIIAKETKDIEKYTANSYRVFLDAKLGEKLDSLQFSNKLEKLLMHNKKISFIIGGSYGFDKNIIRNTDLILSLGSLTFPHMLARLILLEQIYRSFQILQNSPYHK